MRKNSRLLVVFFITLTLFSCKNETDFANFKTFDRVINVSDSMEEVQVNTNLFVVTDMNATDSLLFTFLHKGDEIVKIFYNETLEYIGGFGSEGEGPNEFFHPYQNGFRIYENSTLSMVDRKSLRKIPISIRRDFQNRKIAEAALEEHERHLLPGIMIPLVEGSLLNDSTIIGLNEGFENNQFIKYDFVNKEVSYSNEYPPIEINASPFERAHFLKSYMKISPDHTKIVMSYDKLPLIRIIDIKKEHDEVYTKVEEGYISDIIVDSEGYPIKSQSLLLYYYDIEISNNYIFAGYRKREVSYDKYNNPSQIEYSGNEIHVFDFDGNTILKLKLENWMKEFAVTPNSSYLYLAHPEKENSIFRFKIPEL